jgi:signal transduction histidine kinase
MRLSLRQKMLLGLHAATLVCGGLVASLFPESRLPVGILTAAVIVIGWIVGMVTTAKVQGALGRVRRVADAIARGDFTYRAESDPHDEVAKLTRSFNRMADRLEETVKEQQRLEERLTRSEKLALIGEMAATVAHEINNPLDGLQNCTRIARRNLHDEQQLRQMLDLTEGGLYRIEMIVRRLLSLSKDQVLQLAPTPVDEVVREASLFVESRVARNHIETVTDLPAEPVYALADHQQLVQALINLMLNAADAMPDGGRMTLHASKPDTHRGTLTIAVSDTGSGMTPQEREHIFEPFYSTKGRSSGTGLGLAVVSRIVEAHQGRVDVTSTLGRGSTFSMELPVAVPESAGAVHLQTVPVVASTESGDAS